MFQVRRAKGVLRERVKRVVVEEYEALPTDDGMLQNLPEGPS